MLIVNLLSTAKILVIDEKVLINMTMFEQLYLIGLDESMPFKMIMSKCEMDLKIVGEVSILIQGTDLALRNLLMLWIIIVFEGKP